MNQAIDNVSLEDPAKRIDALAIAVAAPPRRWLGVTSAATYADLSVEFIRRLLASGKLIARRPVKGKILIDKVELDSYITSSTATPRRGRGRRAR